MRRYSFSLVAVSTLFAGTIIFGGNLRAADDGAALYKTKCAPCHGEDGASQTSAGKIMKASDLRSADVQKLSDEDIFGVITKGKNKMPPSRGITFGQAKAIRGHVRMLAKKKS